MSNDRLSRVDEINILRSINFAAVQRTNWRRVRRNWWKLPKVLWRGRRVWMLFAAAPISLKLKLIYMMRSLDYALWEEEYVNDPQRLRSHR